MDIPFDAKERSVSDIRNAPLVYATGSPPTAELPDTSCCPDVTFVCCCSPCGTPEAVVSAPPVVPFAPDSAFVAALPVAETAGPAPLAKVLPEDALDPAVPTSGAAVAAFVSA